jgi:hypothetical protein
LLHLLLVGIIDADGLHEEVGVAGLAQQSVGQRFLLLFLHRIRILGRELVRLIGEEEEVRIALRYTVAEINELFHCGARMDPLHENRILSERQQQSMLHVDHRFATQLTAVWQVDDAKTASMGEEILAEDDRSRCHHVTFAPARSTVHQQLGE